MPLEPVLSVLLLSSLAALVGALGAFPFALPRPPSRAVVGLAYALASGLMLGGGYLLLERALDQGAVAVVIGAVLGVAYTHWVHLYSGIEEVEPHPAAGERAAAGSAPPVDPGGRSTAGSEAGDAGEESEAAAPEVGHDSDDSASLPPAPARDPEAAGGTGAGAPELGYRILLQYALHSAAEGLAIGLAMVLDLRLGVFLAVGLAVHNIGEAMALTEILRRRGVAVGEAAGLCVVAKITQPLLALAAFALAPVWTGVLPGALGFAAGCFVFLVLTELLPGSYRRAAKLPVGVTVSVAAGALLVAAQLFLGPGG